MVAAVALGIAVPVTFGMAVDLIPVRDRGYVAAIITSAAYFPAALLSGEWGIERLTVQVLPPTLAGAAVLGVLAFTRLAFVEKLAHQHALPQFGIGRFVRRDERGHVWINRRLIVLVALMFGIYFVDSLGFLRLIFTPAYMETAWRSPELSPHLVIGERTSSGPSSPARSTPGSPREHYSPGSLASSSLFTSCTSWTPGFREKVTPRWPCRCYTPLR